MKQRKAPAAPASHLCSCCPQTVALGKGQDQRGAPASGCWSTRDLWHRRLELPPPCPLPKQERGQPEHNPAARGAAAGGLAV